MRIYYRTLGEISEYFPIIFFRPSHIAHACDPPSLKNSAVAPLSDRYGSRVSVSEIEAWLDGGGKANEQVMNGRLRDLLRT